MQIFAFGYLLSLALFGFECINDFNGCWLVEHIKTYVHSGLIACLCSAGIYNAIDDGCHVDYIIALKLLVSSMIATSLILGAL